MNKIKPNVIFRNGVGWFLLLFAVYVTHSISSMDPNKLIDVTTFFKLQMLYSSVIVGTLGILILRLND